MNHLDFLDTAERLLVSAAPTEADIRSAISRSYYGGYHHVLLWWKSNNRFPDYKDRGHAKIQIALDNAGISAAEDLSKALRRLNRERRQADYELTINFNLNQGQSVLNRARRAIDAFDAIDKSALAEGIDNYLRTTNQI